MKITINEVAKYLDLPLSTVKRWVRQGRIPIKKSGNNYVFEESVLKKWARTHNLLFSIPDNGSTEQKQEKQTQETLLSVIQTGNILYNIKGDDVESVLQSAVAGMTSISQDIKDQLYERLLQRENLTSTGIGKGIAIPHPRTPMTDQITRSLITTCFLEKPIDFNAVDNKPVFVMFILLSPDSKTHLHLLSRLSFCVRDNTFIDFLKTSPEPKLFYSKIESIESSLDKKGML